MKQFSWKKLIPHIIAVVVFLVIAIIYCKPALDGQVLQQSDIIHWKGMAQDAIQYKAQHGHLPLWNTRLFSGMPNYQIDMEGKSYIPDFSKILSLGLPKPANFFFLACLSFYILLMAFGCSPVIGILGALSYAYSTYNPVIMIAGHETKMMAIAFMPGLLAGLNLLYRKYYLWGTIVSALFAMLEIGANHPQINYYFILTAAIMTIFYIVKWIKAGEFKHMIIALSIAAVTALIGAGNSALMLMTTFDYAKYSMRGGKSIDATAGQPAKAIQKTQGLDHDYAFMWSMSKSEPLEMLMPNAFGGSSSETFDEESGVASAFTNAGAPAQYATQLPKYWGGLEGTSGPAYIGALSVFLAIIGLVVLKKEDKWWMIVSVGLGVVLACGKFMPGINNFLFDHLPLYNKFRAPSMALVIPQLIIPLMAGLTLKMISLEKVQETFSKNLKPILYAAGGLVLLCVLVYFFNDYSSPMDDQLKQALGGGEQVNPILNAMRADRKSMFTSGLLHAILFGIFALGGVILILKRRVSAMVIIIVFTVINTVDLLMVDSKYLNSESFNDPQQLDASSFNPTPQMQQVMQDKDPHYRVLNLSTGDPFQDAITSYNLRSIGGYNPAKLRIYQDIIETQMTGSLNPHVLDMLDARYVITQPASQQQPSSVQRNPNALGAAWFVKDVKYFNAPVDVLNGLKNFDPKSTVLALQSDNGAVKTANPDTAATIKLSSYDNDNIVYNTSSSTPQYAVFSEVYYPSGWNATIDGKEVAYQNVDYVLRGLNIPAGQHKIEFSFHPVSYYTGQKVVYGCNLLFWLVIGISIVGLVKTKKEDKSNLA